jgi:hypothetical protein
MATTYAILGVLALASLLLRLAFKEGKVRNGYDFMFVRDAELISSRTQLDHIPTVGSQGFLGTWRSGFRFLSKAREMVQEGYEKVWSVHSYGRSLSKIAVLRV